MPAALELRSLSYEHPDVVALTAAAQRFYVQTYGGPDESPVSVDEFAPPRGDFLVGYLIATGQPVVMGGWRFTDAAIAAAQRPAELKRMFVVDDQRGRGLAREMLDAVERSALDGGADALVLETGAPQLAAISLYRSAGYVDIAPFGHYAESDTVVTLGKRLRP